MTEDLGSKTFESALVGLPRLRMKYISFIVGFLLTFKIKGDAAEISADSNNLFFSFSIDKDVFLHHPLLMLLTLPRASSRPLRLYKFPLLKLSNLLLLLIA